jgi:hypothetical protein
MGKMGKTKGLYKTKLFEVHHSMMGRCYNSNRKDFSRYGGRGIKVCDRWHDPLTFILDARKLGYQPGLTIDRIDVNGDYEPSNVRFADKHTQDNNRRTNRNLTLGNRTMTLQEWSTETGIDRHTLTVRIDRLGWSVEDTLTIPLSNEQITHKGETLSYVQWSNRTGIPAKTILKRLKMGWSADRILGTPIMKGR